MPFVAGAERTRCATALPSCCALPPRQKARRSLKCSRTPSPPAWARPNTGMRRAAARGDLGTDACGASACLALLPCSKFLGRQVATYISARLASPPEQAVLIVAVPCDGAGGGEAADDDTALTAPPPLLGVVELSLSPRTHGRFDDASVAPPAHALFVKNALTSPAARRRGVAAALLVGVEDYARAAAALASLDDAQRGRTPLELCLHCTLGDVAASALYAAAGYTAISQQNGVVAALRRSAPPVALMRKRL